MRKQIRAALLILLIGRILKYRKFLCGKQYEGLFCLPIYVRNRNGYYCSGSYNKIKNIEKLSCLVLLPKLSSGIIRQQKSKVFSWRRREYKKRHCGVICGVFLALELTNGQQFSIVCSTLINYRNGVKVFKTKVESQATGEWFYCRFLNFLTSFLWSIRVYIITLVILAFWLVLAYDLLENRRTIDVITTKFFPLCFKMAESFEKLYRG